jgi:site-specific recombinase XerD
MYYFGKNRDEALRLYHEQATSLHRGRGRSAQVSADLSLRALSNLYLEYQSSRAAVDEISHRHFYDLKSRLRQFAKFIGPNQKVSEIPTFKIQSYRQKQIKDGKRPDTINTKLSPVKSLFNWARDNGVVDQIPNLRAVKKVPVKKSKRQIFTAEEIQILLDLKQANTLGGLLRDFGAGAGAKRAC